MKKRTFSQRLLAILLALVMVVSPVVSGIQTEAEESQAASYYEDLNAADAAVMAACGIGDASKYTDVQADRIIIFVNEWSLKAYAATTKEEADAVLADAVAAYKEIKINDSAAMAEYEKLMGVRGDAIDECMVVLEANIANIKYTKTSRREYELEARECLSALSIVTTYEKIDEQVAAFEICSSILVELSEDIVAAKEEAKLRIREIIKEEFEGCFAEFSYDNSINDADTLEEIQQAIEDAWANMLLSVNKDINSYRNRKIDRLQELLTEYETELRAAGVEDEPILVCTGAEFADSLSASATGYPILLVGKKGLTEAQLNFLQEHAENPCYIIGGTGAVSAAVEKRIAADMTVKRISGGTRLL